MIQYLALLSPLLPILAFLIFCLKEKKSPLWVIFIYTVASFSADMYSSVIRWGREHQIIVWNIFTSSEFLLLMIFFYLILREFKISLTVGIIVSAYILLAVFTARKTGEEFNSIMSAANALSFLILSILYFIRQLGSSDNERTLPVPIFLIVAGIMLAVASTFFLYLISSKLTEAQKDKYWSLNAFANILTNVIFAIAFILNRFQKKVPAAESHTSDFDGFPYKR